MKRARASICALVVIALGIPPSSVASTAPSVQGTLTLASTSGTPGAAIRLAGKVAPHIKHQVKLQRREDGTFVTLASKMTDQHGSFSFKTTLPQGRATASYRVFSPSKQSAYVTPTRTIVGGITTRITDGNDISRGPAISADGGYIAYQSFTTTTTDVFLWARRTGTTTRINHSNAGSPAISADGRYVAYISSSGVLLWARDTGTTTRITDGQFDNSNPAISANGRYVTYVSNASDVFLWDRNTGTITRISQSEGKSGSPAISADGRYVAYETWARDWDPGDANAASDVFVWERGADTRTRITHGNHFSVDPAISADGRRITYWRNRSVFMWDRSTGMSTSVVHGVDISQAAAISADGRYVTYISAAPDLVPGDTNKTWDVFVWDRATGTTTRVTDGSQRSSGPAAMSAHGRNITFSSLAPDLVPGDDNKTSDVFVWDRSN